jgi:hypothetical protein
VISGGNAESDLLAEVLAGSAFEGVRNAAAR